MAGYQVINAVALKETASAKVFDKLVQDILHVNGKGVDESYINGSGLGTSSVAIPKVALGDGAFRQLGATINGGQFNGKDTVISSSDYIYVPLTYTYDRTETLARIMNDKAGYDLLGAKTENIKKKIARGINALTFAVQIARTLNESYETSATYVTQDASNNSMYNNFVDANAKLSEGDEAIGCDYFPTESRQAFFTPAGFAELKKDKDRYIYSDLAQEMLATGVLNPFTNSEASKVQMRDGYCGVIDGTPCYQVSPILLKLATTYCRSNSLGLPTWAFDDIKAIVCSSVGTLRGFISEANIEVVPAQAGQGWVLQPLVHGGCVCISGKSVRMIVKNGFTNIVTSDATKIAILPPESNTDELVVTIGDAGTSGDTKNKAAVTVKDKAGNTISGATVYYGIGTDYAIPTTSSTSDVTLTVTSTNVKASVYAAKAGYITSALVNKTLTYTA